MTAVGAEVDLGLRLLDDQLIDADGHRCGRVDDVQLRGSPGAMTEVAALLVGAGAWTGRLRRPFARLVEGLGPGYVRCIRWSEVIRVGTSVELAHSAKDLGLETSEGRNVQWVDSRPPGTIRVAELLRSRLVTTSGTDLGRIWDVRVERGTELPDEHVNEPWRVTGLIGGTMGWKERIGLSPEADPAKGESFIPWESVRDLGTGVVTVFDSVAP
jgi:sporulation protein YlmC with PRC-barrel domain